MNENYDAQQKDRELFDRIALNYSEKDIYPVSRIVRKFQIDTLLNLLTPYSKQTIFNNIIELGCGNGANSIYLEKRYKKYTGMDFSSELIKIADNKYGCENRRFYSGNISDLKDEKYDIVVCVGVLHHLPDLEEYLGYISRAGNKETLFLFLEPQGKNPLIQFLRIIRKNIDPSYSKTQKFFHKKELIEKFNKAGFDILNIQYTGYFTPPFAQVIIKPVWLFAPLVKLLIKTDSFIHKYFPNRLSWNISFIAKRRVD